MRLRLRRDLTLPAFGLSLVFTVGPVAPALARTLQVNQNFPCPDPTVCSCPGAAGDCFRFVTIGEAMTAAVSGDSILVAAATYTEPVTLKSGVFLEGGYDAAFTSSNPQGNPTTISGGGTGPAIFSPPAMSATTIVRGFILTGGGGDPGAGVVIQGGATVFRDNEIRDNVLAGIAGGVYIFGGSLARLENNVIADNETEGSGGGVRIDFSSPIIASNTIERNIARHSGGGIHVVGGNPTISNNMVRENDAGDGGGGGLHLQNVTISNAISGNDFIENDGIYGGGVTVKDQCIVSFDDNDFFGNGATRSGGGMYVIGRSEVSLTSNRFQFCVAESLYGGGLYVFQSDADVVGDDPTTSTPDASFTNCTAKVNGGAIYAFDAEGVISGIRAQDCTADSAGGGIFISGSLFTLSKNLVVDCTAFEAGGVGIWFNGAGTILQSKFYSNTIYGCAALDVANGGGGLTVFGNGQDNVAEIAGNLISHTRQGSALRCKRAPPGPLQTARPTIACSTFHIDPTNPVDPADTIGGDRCQESFSSDATNRIGDPLYCAAGVGNFALQLCSPDVDSSCPPAGKPGIDDRGVPYASNCACALTSLEPASWGRIKASYR